MSNQSLIYQKIIVIYIAVVVGLLHFLTGPGYTGPFPVFVNGYLIDILLPFAMYLVIGIANLPFLGNSISKGILVFVIGAISETLQYFGIPIFGRTFDMLDYLMFGIGIGFAVIFETIVLSRIPVKIVPRSENNSK